jgi:hypothetical protein
MNKSTLKSLLFSGGLLAVLWFVPQSVHAALTVGSTTLTTDSTLSLQGGNIGIGDLTPVAALVIGSDTTAGVANGTGDLYVQNDLEVDGSITGTLKVSGFDGTMYTAVSGNLTAISGMSWSTSQEALVIGTSVSSDGELQLRRTYTDTTANTASGSQLAIAVSDLGAVTSGSDGNTGQSIIVSRRFATGGIITTTGSDITVSGDNAGAGTHTLFGQIITVSASGTNPDAAYGLYVYAGTGYAAIFSGGNVGIDTDTPTDRLDINSTNIRIRTATTPASNATCDQGEIAWGADYVYVCVSTNTWKRSALTAY